MTDRCARIVLTIALLPLIFGVWMIVGYWLQSSVKGPTLVATALCVTTTVLMWRRYVRWTTLRSMSTAGITSLVLAHVVVWQPLWNVGCMKEPLITAQSLSAGAAWMTLCSFIWWAPLLARHTTPEPRKFAMTPNAVRLTIGIALGPFLVGLFWILYFALSDFGGPSFSSPVDVCTSYVLCCLVAVASWLLIWKTAVKWTRRRRLITLALAAVLICSPACVVWANSSFGQLWEMACNLAPVFAYALWLAGTAWTWRTDRPQTVPGLAALAAEGGLASCPQCGYSLTGLREVRCPECGWASTVDDIVERSLTNALAVP